MELLGAGLAQSFLRSVYMRREFAFRYRQYSVVYAVCYGICVGYNDLSCPALSKI